MLKKVSGLAEEQEDLSLEQQQEALTREYLELREQSAADPKLARKLSRVAGKLDGLYWKIVEDLVTNRVAADVDELSFSDEERLIIDFGLIDIDLVEGADASLPQKLIGELNLPGHTNHFYLSEWLEDRYRRYRLTEIVAAVSKRDEDAKKEKGKARLARIKVFERLSPMFDGLPGVSKDVLFSLRKGGLDEQLQRANIALLEKSDKKLFQYRRRLFLLRQQVLDKAMARVTDKATLKLFDMLNEIYAIDWRERYEKYKAGIRAEKLEKAVSDATEESDEASRLARDAAVDYLVSELRFMRTLLPIGGLAGGVTKTNAVMLSVSQRVTKDDTANGLALSETCDRDFNLKSVVVIAPFKGRGIFEWDRDSLVVPLVPAQSAEGAVVNAAGNYHMLIDSLQQGGALRKRYEESFPEDNYQQAFQADYRAWVAGIGHGKADAMDGARFAFFKENVGPDYASALAPAGLRNLGPQTREAVKKRLAKQISISQPDPNLFHRLGSLCWLDEEYDEAIKHMASATKLAPGNGMILFSLALLLMAKGDAPRAKGIFEACCARVPDSLWSIYSRDELKKI
ncbi:MAG: hypothetical protein JXR97_09075 [Planctomycetes bacterium]|nr:hypothetical protein [Planctomycetota bacterium]